VVLLLDSEHEPVVTLQHAPAHWFGLHVLPIPRNVLPAGQADADGAVTHTPAVEQHAPPHATPAHVVPAPWKKLPGGQF
jgi:hypothetical protein